MQRLLILILCVLFSSQALSAQSVGLYSSPKGIGASYVFENHDKYDFLTVYADIYGMWRSRTSKPGVKLNYSRCTQIYNKDLSQGGRFYAFVGPGMSAGYVRDNDMSVSSKERLVRNAGCAIALSGRLSGILDFKEKRMGVELSFLLEVGMHIRRDEILKQNDLSWYQNGIYQALMPQITLYYKL